MNKRINIFAFLHVTWLVLWLLVLGIMMLPASQAGHPPIVIFAPYAIVFGVLGQLFIFIVQFIYNYSSRVKPDSIAGTHNRDWPWQLKLALLVLGYFSFYQLIFNVLFSPFIVAIYSIFFNVNAVNTASGGPVFPLYYVLYTLTVIATCFVALYGLIVRKKWTYRLILVLCALEIVIITAFLAFFIYQGKVDSVLFRFLPVIILTPVYMYSYSRSGKVKQFFGLLE
jgi:hypothetical protein